jgi:hypothetical protein
MNQAKAGLRIKSRKSFQPSQAFFADACERRENRLLHHGKNGRNLRVCDGLFRQTFRRPKHLIRIPANPGPPQRADLIDDLRRVSSARSQIPAMDNEVRRNLPQVRDNGLEGAPIAVNIRNDCDSHFVRRLPGNCQTQAATILQWSAEGNRKPTREARLNDRTVRRRGLLENSLSKTGQYAFVFSFTLSIKALNKRRETSTQGSR